MNYDSKDKVLKKATVWEGLYFYRKSDAIYQLTVAFCKRFLPVHDLLLCFSSLFCSVSIVSMII